MKDPDPGSVLNFANTEFMLSDASIIASRFELIWTLESYAQIDEIYIHYIKPPGTV